jgi:ectoine hydroxylase-related dioxygenase (phytanoyl-CoA dioxygenase family)
MSTERWFNADDPEAVKHFVKEGFVIVRGLHESALINQSLEFFLGRMNQLRQLCANGEIPDDMNGWVIAIIEKFARTDLYEKFITCPALLDVLKSFLGPDICILGYDALWINVPGETDPVLKKALHTDTWTGTSINSIFVKTFFTDVDAYNGLSVCPGSHLQGLIPVRNRQVDPNANLDFPILNLDYCKAGDVLLMHALLLHATTGHSPTNTRISVTSRYTSPESEFSSQERALGYRTLTVGPMNQIKRMIGNDYLTPLRTYGGHTGIDRRLEAIYPYGNYANTFDYAKFID